MPDRQAVLSALLSYKPLVSQEELTPALFPEATLLIHDNPFAFLSACCLDRGTKAEVIWTIPYWLSLQVGHYDPLRFRSLNLDEIASLFYALPRKPRYINDAPRTFSDITRLVVDRFAGQAESVWKDRLAMEVKKDLLSVHGVGSGIASMTLVLLESAYDFTFPDHSRMDIKPDVHTMRVLFRLGAAAAESVEEATAAAQWLNPSFPGLIDGPLWSIGRNWCRPSAPDCPSCPLSDCCEKVDLLSASF